MLKWNNQDPVSQKEIDRNNGTYTFQNNRNPFIDSPQYVNRIWNQNCPGLSVLPVNLIFFTGKQNGVNILLKWEVNNEINLSEYQVEKSTDEANFKTITTIQADGSNNYSYTDFIGHDNGKNIYYRLKKIDKMGSVSYSEVFKINLPKEPSFSIYPNPARDVIQIDNLNFTSKTAAVVINDVMGRKVLGKSFNNIDGLIKISTKNIPNGNYIIKVSIGETSYSTVIIIAK